MLCFYRLQNRLQRLRFFLYLNSIQDDRFYTIFPVEVILPGDFLSYCEHIHNASIWKKFCVQVLHQRKCRKKIQKSRLSVWNFAKNIVKTTIFFNIELYEHEGVQIHSIFLYAGV